MNRPRFCLLLIASLAHAASTLASEALPSWVDSDAKQAIVSFVQNVTSEDSHQFVPNPKRIAVFDNDGCLWSEKPFYFQLQFAIDRIKQLAPKHPEWQADPLLKAVLDGDQETVIQSGEEGLAKLIMITHAGMTSQEFSDVAKQWLDTAKHPRFGVRYRDLTYQPMLELLDYLRANNFKTFIVSGGGIEFVRAYAEEAYGIPPEQVVGSTIKTKFVMQDGEPQIIRLPKIDFIDDKLGKPLGIQKFIGRRPIAAFGNSDGDLQMLQWTTTGQGARLGLIVHHTDQAREWAYDRKSKVGQLDKALDQAQERGWVVVNMKRDWSKIYPTVTPTSH